LMGFEDEVLMGKVNLETLEGSTSTRMSKFHQTSTEKPQQHIKAY
jgi:hypothetical protein